MNSTPTRTSPMRILAPSSALALLAFLAACGGGGPPVPASVMAPPLAPVAEGDRLYYDNSGGIADSVRIVVRTSDEFTEVWGRATSRQSEPPPVPTVDFADRMVVVVGAGRLTPEDQIRVDSVGIRTVTDAAGEDEDVLAVIVRTIQGCGRFAVDAYPVEIVAVPRFAGDVRFVERTSRDPNCGPDHPMIPPTR